MARYARTESDSGVYHAMLRGINRRGIIECGAHRGRSFLCSRSKRRKSTPEAAELRGRRADDRPGRPVSRAPGVRSDTKRTVPNCVFSNCVFSNCVSSNCVSSNCVSSNCVCVRCCGEKGCSLKFAFSPLCFIPSANRLRFSHVQVNSFPLKNVSPGATR